jgi:tetratricopeptide repeat protein 8
MLTVFWGFRPITSASGRHVRLGTASMLSEPDGPFINVSKLDLSKYAERPNLSKALFEYVFHKENDVRNALELAAKATEACDYKDWWWKVQLGKCYFRLGMFREAEQQLKSALKQQEMVDTFLHLCKVYVRLDEPLKAIESFTKGLERFPGEVTLLTGLARIHEGIGEIDTSVEKYKEVLKYDNMHVEAIACVATQHFYTDLPEIALLFYRRLLQMGVYSTELFNNLGLCSYYAQQYDVAVDCFSRALDLASDDEMADVWYNIGHLAVNIGDTELAYRCFRLAIAVNNDHAESYNNLGVLELRKGRSDQARALFQQSLSLAPHFYEPHFNSGAMEEKAGNLQSSYNSMLKSLEAFPDHADSKELLKKIKDYFAAV